MKKTLRIVAFLLAMLMMLAMFAGCNKNKKEEDDEDVENTPEAAFRNSLASFATDLGELPVLKTWLNMCQHGSLELQGALNVGELAASMGETGVRGQISAGGKFYYSSNGFFIQNLNLDIYAPDDDVNLSVSGDLFMSPDYIYVKNDNILGGAVGLISGEMAKALENCAWKDEIPAEMMNMFIMLAKFYDGDMDQAAEDAIEDIRPVVERYIEVISDSLEKNAKFTDEIKSVTVGGEDVESRVVTLTVDEKAVVGLINDVYAVVKDDAELRALIVKYGDMLKDYTGGTGEDLAQAYDQMLTELGSQLDSLDEEIPQGAIRASVATPKDASTLRKLVVSMRDGGEDAETVDLLTLDAGKGGVLDTNCITLDIMGETAVSYKIDQNDESGYKASLIATYMAYPDTKVGEEPQPPYQETMTCFTLEVNKQAGTYALSIPEANLAMGGTFKVEGDKTTILFNSLTIENETYNKGFSMTLIIDENDEMPAVLGKDQVTNVFDLTMDDINTFVDRFDEVFGDLMDRVGPEEGNASGVALPNGYQLFDDGSVSFGYPEDWSKSTQGTGEVIILSGSNGGNNITVSREVLSSYYRENHYEIFKSDVMPALETAGYKVSDVHVEYVDKTDNVTGAPELTTVVYYTLEYNGFMDQMLLFFNVGEYTYSICVTTVDQNYEIEDTALETLRY